MNTKTSSACCYAYASAYGIRLPLTSLLTLADNEGSRIELAGCVVNQRELVRGLTALISEFGRNATFSTVLEAELRAPAEPDVATWLSGDAEDFGDTDDMEEFDDDGDEAWAEDDEDDEEEDEDEDEEEGDAEDADGWNSGDWGNDAAEDEDDEDDEDPEWNHEH